MCVCVKNYCVIQTIVVCLGSITCKHLK
jgi:hypothetical protein